MPQIYASKILSFSSEDKAFPASNLLKSSSFSKWRGEKGGTKQEVIDFSFEEPVEVNRLDIGNNGSAFIEVLVRRSALTVDPTVFLPCSSFMSPVESKNETNLTRVRMFSSDQFLSAVSTQKWDVFRFVCTQPFNKTLPYGISFISFHTPSPKIQAQTAPDNALNSSTASVALKDEDEDSLVLRPGALFQASKAALRSEISTPVTVSRPLSVAEKLVAVRHSTNLGVSTTDAPTTLITTNAPISSASCASVNRVDPLRNVNPSNSGLKASKITHSRSPVARSESSPLTPTATPHVPKGSKSSSSNPMLKASRPSTSFVQCPQSSSSFSHPLSDVIFSLSGYQNPLRNELRKKALDLGATFRQNWSTDCTHLICAFPNTPKFKEAKNKGIIISDKWIQQCYLTKSKVNWRPYRVGRAPSPVGLDIAIPSTTSKADISNDENSPVSSPGSDSNRKSLKKKVRSNNDDEDWHPDKSSSTDSDEDDEGDPSDEFEPANSEREEEEGKENDPQKFRKKSKRRDKKGVASKRSVESIEHVEGSKRLKSTEADSASPSTTNVISADRSVGEGLKPVRRKVPPATNDNPPRSSLNANLEDEDTDDEIQRVLSPSIDINQDDSASVIDCGVSGGDADANKLTESMFNLPNVFDEKHFFVHAKDIPEDKERLIRRLIVAFSGNLHPYMHPDVQFVVTCSPWNEEFDSALKDNASLVFVRPDWIFACDQQAKWVPFQKYLVVG
ncbi:hypothetical protein PHET_01418 [Paragonimus heterotremus]|uniref:BRCT domain-containing protein n=1 Tax=Paragonimus heterotremus TaxID=100268 RepID=A0A8J4STR1_9TREM|nr:hypothetical protein PHET_01418 [Paragonimus heterotremus]